MNDVEFRLRALIVDTVWQHGCGSPEHMVLRHVLCDEGERRISLEAELFVVHHEQELRDGGSDE